MDLVIRAAFVYVFVYLVLRALGKRELGELSAFELVLLFVIGDLIQQSVTQNDTSITAAVLAISTITLLILIQSYVAFRWSRIRPVIEGEPAMIVDDGRILAETLRRERMTGDDVMESARRQGIGDLSDVRFAILEPDGKVSFITRGPVGRPDPDEGHVA